MKNDVIPHPHPGDTLKEDWMAPYGLTAYQVAKALGVQQTAVGQIINGKRSISAEMALRLEKYTGASAGFWLGLQDGYDLAKAKKKIGRKVEKIHRFVPEPGLKHAA